MKKEKYYWNNLFDFTSYWDFMLKSVFVMFIIPLVIFGILYLILEGVK